VIWRVTTGLVILALLLPFTAHATTAPDLSARIHIDGVLDEYASDEWVLDDSTALAERSNDSAWGSGNEIARAAITWDEKFLYLAVEGRTFDTFLSLFLSNRAGGLRSLEGAGLFRRAIEFGGVPLNLIALAEPSRIPDVARADDAHAFGLVDRGTLRRAISGDRSGVVGFEMAVPWSMLTLAKPVRVVTAITGDPGTGAGDSAPDASVFPDDDRFARAVLDRGLVIHADIDADGVAGSGISPRSAATIEGGTVAASPRADAKLEIAVSPRAFAPDRGESALFSFRTATDEPIFASAAVFSLEGDLVRTLFADEERVRLGEYLAPGANDAWDGRDAAGEIVRGAGYVVVVDWGFARGEKSGRAKTAVVVVR
jgi:hypothetical protein